MDKYVDRFIKVYPWFFGMSGDLLFYIAIDTLFLSIVKNLSAAEIVSITSLSMLICIVLQFPILFLIKKIGNTASIRCAGISLLLASIFVTFGNSYLIILIGRTFHGASRAFQAATVVALENNLDMVGKREEFVRVRATANMTYSIITMIISFVVSYMFNFNHYLPMLCCIGTCTVGVVLSFFLKDSTSYNKITYQKSVKSRVKIQYNKFIVEVLAVYALFYAVVANGQDEGKLFIQQNILLHFDVEQTALVIGVIVCISRILRVLSNIIVKRVYQRYRAKLGVALPILLCVSIGCMLFGSFIPISGIKILVMGIGYIIILFSRDPFNIYMQDTVLKNTPKEQHQALLTILEFAVKLASAGFGLIYSAILITCPMLVVIAIVFIVAIIEIVLGLKLYTSIKTGEAAKLNGEVTP